MNEDVKQTVWVVGHRNPDTDSICAAISYAYLKNKVDPAHEYLPKKAGELNGETRYVLKRFSVQEPETVTDVSTQICDIDLRRTAGVNGHLSLKRAWELMEELDVVTLPVVREDGLMEGLIVNGDIAKSYMNVIDNSVLSRARTQYRNIIETIDGHMVVGNEHAYFTKGKVAVAAGSHRTIRNDIDEDDPVMVGNVLERQMVALETRPSCIIVTKTTPWELDLQFVEEAQDIDCIVITTEYDTFTAARLINQSIPIRYFMTKEKLVTFDLDDTVDEVRERMSKIRHRDFPVLDEQHRYVGMFSRRHLLNTSKKQIILVDHNERSQAVEGIDEAEILEIIDHHRLGSLETIQPIYFRNMPLGCSSTIIYLMYQEQGVEIPEYIAGLMLSAILSDTLMFRSPTCTETDKKAAESLSVIAGVDIEELAMNMFEAGSDFGSKTAREIFYTDFKTFYAGEIAFGVSQISAVTTKQLDQMRQELKDEMIQVIADKGLSMVFVMLTNILEQKTELLYEGGNAEHYALMAFGENSRDKEGRIMLPGVVSRKKQLVPPIIEAIQKDE